MKVKVCGMRDPQNIREVSALHPDYMGFIFYAPSSRCCTGIDPEVIRNLPKGTEPVMVTVDMEENEILKLAQLYGFKWIQLHGKESPEMCSRLRNQGLKVVKAFGIQSKESLRSLEEYKGCVDVFLFDTACATKGGSGRQFDWEILDYYNMGEDFWLSGGIGPDDAESLKELKHPRFAGIDLNSRFEISPALKDPNLLNSFLHKIL